jgi:subtilase family serine protease
MSDSKHAKKQRRSIQHGKTNNDPSLAAAPAQQQGKRHSGHGKRKAAAHSITFEAIEPRILLSADPLGMALPVATASYTASDWTDSTPLVALSQDLPPVPIPAASNPVDGSAAEDEPLLTALSAVPATQSQLSISNVEVTLDPDGRVKAGSNIFITVKNTSESTFYGYVWVNLELSNNENGTGPRQDLMGTNGYHEVGEQEFLNLIQPEHTKIGDAIVYVGNGKRSIESQQEIVLAFTGTSWSRINGTIGDLTEIGARSDMIEAGTAYLHSQLLTGEHYPNQSINLSNVITSPAFNVSFADLEIVDFVVPDRIVVGETVEFAVTVRNRGNIDANYNNESISAVMRSTFTGTVNAEHVTPGTRSHVNIYPDLGTNNLYVSNYNESFVNLAPGDTHTFKFRYNYFMPGITGPDGLVSIQQFQLFFSFKPQGTVDNSFVNAFRMNDERLLKTGNFPLTQVARPDLVLEVEDVSVVGGGLNNGLGTPINYKITNIGQVPIVNETLSFKYRFTYNGLTSAYTLTTLSNMNFQPGESFTGQVAWFPDYFRSGDKKLNFDGNLPVDFSISASQSLIEKNTLNNKVTEQVAFGSLPEFWANSYGYKDDIYLRRFSLISGQTATTQWTVKNEKLGAAQLREDAFYWSKDYYWDVNDILATKVTSMIPAGDSTTVTEASLLLPEPGQWYLIFRVDSSESIRELYESNNFASSTKFTIKSGPDLTVDSVTAPSSAIAGNDLEVKWKSRNDGDTAVSGQRKERVVLRKGEQQFEYDVTYTDTIEPGKFKDRTLSITPPVTLAGTWEVSVIVDPENEIGESGQESNNEALVRAQVNIQGSDLTIGTVTAASTVIAGESLDVSWDARNLGAAAVSFSRIERVVLRKEGQQSITYDFTYTDTIEADPLVSVSRKQSILIPATLTGTWEISVIVDPDNDIMEQVETNNEAPVPTQVNIVAGRNLVVSDVQGPSMAIAEQTVQVDWRVRNTGGGAALQGWKDRIYLSSDGALTSDDTLLTTVSNQSTLAAGAEYAASAWVQLPDNIAQNFRILVVTDASGQVAEAVETDNVTASEQFLVTDTPPQLVASALITPPSMLSNVPTAISWTVTNSGSGPVANVSWTDSIFISADAFFDSGDERVADFTYQGPLAKDAAVTRHENITLPQGRAGSFYFFVFTDSRNQIYEYGAEEDNRTFRRDGNNQIAPVDVFATNPPDLEVEALGLSTSTALSGQVISVQATIANNGAAALSQYPGWTDQFYLSSDTTLDVEDISLGQRRWSSGLAVGASYTVNMDLSLGDLGSGTYYVIAVADSTLIVSTTSASALRSLSNACQLIFRHPMCRPPPSLLRMSQVR